MQRLTLVLLLIAFIGSARAEIFPDDLYAMPLGNELPDHQWSFRQGLDFDTINFKNSKGKGIHMYMGISESSAVTTDSYLDAVVMDKPTKLYEKCAAKNDCMYSTLINTGGLVNGNVLWAQIWIKPENKKDLDTYIDWLSSLKFETRQ